MAVKVDRWVMTVEFDPVAEVRPTSRPESGFSEAEEFYGFCVGRAESEWGFLSEEVREGVEQEGDTVTVSLNLIDPFEVLFSWVVAHTIPRSVKFERTESR